MAQGETWWPRAAALTAMLAVVFTIEGSVSAQDIAAVVHPPPASASPYHGLAWWMTYTGSGGPRTRQRQLWPNGGKIPLQGSEWRCAHTKPKRESRQVFARKTGNFHPQFYEQVELKCTYGGRSVRTEVGCFHSEGEIEFTTLTLENGDGTPFDIDIECAYFK